MSYKLIVIVGIVLTTAVLKAQSTLDVYDTVQTLPSRQGFILTSHAIATAPRHIFLDPSTTHVHVQTADYNFDKEEQTFRAFKRRYAVFWTVFNTLLILRFL